jgi:hypothetical protein
MLEPLKNPANWDNFRKAAVLVLIIWATATAVLCIIYFFVWGGPQPCAGGHIQGAYFACPLYRSGHTSDWLKFKNTEAPAVTREAEEEWGK